MERTRVFLAIRISAAALCFVTCLLTAGLWMRSHYRIDSPDFFITKHSGCICTSIDGILGFQFTDAATSQTWFSFDSYPNTGVESKKLLWPSAYGFYIARQTQPRFIQVQAPHWFFLFAFGGLGTALLIRWRRQFAVRTLLILTTIAAVVLGLMVY